MLKWIPVEFVYSYCCGVMALRAAFLPKHHIWSITKDHQTCPCTLHSVGSTSLCLSLVHLSLIPIISILVISAHLCFSLVRGMKRLHFGVGTLQGGGGVGRDSGETGGRATIGPAQINRRRLARMTENKSKRLTKWCGGKRWRKRPRFLLLFM